MGNLQDAKALSPLWPGPFSDVGNNARLVADEIKPELGCMGQVVTPFPDDVEDMHDFRFDEGTDDDGFADPRVRFLVRADAARQECYAEVGHNGLDHEITLARFKDDFRLETDFLAVLNDFVVEIEIIAVEDERFIGQFFERNRFFLRQDVVAMDDDIHGILCEEERFEFLFLRLRADDAQIDEAFLDADFNLFRTVFIEVQLDLRVFLFEGTQQVGKNRCARDRGQADEDRTLFQLEFIFEVRLQMFKHEDDAFGVGQENCPGVR